MMGWRWWARGGWGSSSPWEERGGGEQGVGG